MANVYDVGTLVKVSVTFEDPSGVAADPANVFLNYRPGNSTTVTTWQYMGTGSIARDSAGVYHANLDTTGAPGDWQYRWYATGTGQTASDGMFIVQDSAIK